MCGWQSRHTRARCPLCLGMPESGMYTHPRTGGQPNRQRDGEARGEKTERERDIEIEREREREVEDRLQCKMEVENETIWAGVVPVNGPDERAREG